MNAPRPLQIPSYDGSGENVHPDVVDTIDGFGGHRYWMACTPYPMADDRLENPALRVSGDGHRWDPVPGCPDPLVPPPSDPESHRADPDLILEGGRLHLFFMTTSKRTHETKFSWMHSDDGRAWSEPTVVHRSLWGVSPAIAVVDGTWFMWYVHLDTTDPGADAELRLRRGDGPDSWGDVETCHLEIPGNVPWHIDVQFVGDSVRALVAAFPRGTDSSHTRLFAAATKDMRRFELLSLDPILRPSRIGWDGRFIYRSTFTVDADDIYRIWYTGGSWDRRHGIGYVEGPLDALRPIDVRGRNLGERLRWLYRSTAGFARFTAKRVLPERFVRTLRAAIQKPSSRRER